MTPNKEWHPYVINKEIDLGQMEQVPLKESELPKMLTDYDKHRNKKNRSRKKRNEKKGQNS